MVLHLIIRRHPTEAINIIAHLGCLLTMDYINYKTVLVPICVNFHGLLYGANLAYCISELLVIQACKYYRTFCSTVYNFMVMYFVRIFMF